MAANKTIYLNLEPHMISPESGATVQVKLDDEGIVVDAWSLDDCIASTWETYNELGVEVKKIKNEAEGEDTYSQQMQDELEPIQEPLDSKLNLYNKGD